MEEQFSRTVSLLGQDAFNSIQGKRVLILGIGGVGGFVAEALARAGVENFTLVDNDVVSLSNINRQIIALNSTLGRAKVDVMKERILDINPLAVVSARQEFITPSSIANDDFSFDYVIDCIDNITAKIALAIESEKRGFKLISCMGTGNKLKPEMFEIADIYKTSVCPLAKIMRKKLKDENVKKLTVLYSKEEPINNGKTRVPASISFTPSIAGLRIAEYVIKEFLKS